MRANTILSLLLILAMMTGTLPAHALAEGGSHRSECSQGQRAHYEKQADKLIITLAEGSTNTLTDGAAITDGDDTIGAALYAEDDLSINGSGTLIAHGTAKHGIQSKADLIIAGGSITVDAANDGIRQPIRQPRRPGKEHRCPLC